MTLAFLIYSWFPWGGQQRDCLRIARACTQRGHRVRVYTMKWQGEVPDDIELRHVPVNAWSRPRLYQRYRDRVRRALAEEPVDCVLGFARMPGLDVYFAADPCFADKAFHERSRLYRLTPRCRHLLAWERAVFGGEADTEVLLLSAQQRERYLAWYPDSAKRLHLLPPGLDPARRPPAAPERDRIRRQVRRSLGLGEARNLVLQVGAGLAVKGVDRALRAIAALPPDIRTMTSYVVIGSDRPGRFLRLAQRLGIGDQCLFLGGREDVQHFLLAANLLLHPAYRESAGHVLLEAAINGLPVLTTDTCGYADHVLEAGAGEVIPSPFRQQDLDRRLQWMLSSRADQRRWRENGLRYGSDERLYRMPETVVDHLEQRARRAGVGEA